jgi:hypothetical protein
VTIPEERLLDDAGFDFRLPEHRRHRQARRRRQASRLAAPHPAH